MKFSIFHHCSPRTAPPTSPENNFNLREEYANAFRTESYNEFWAHVLDVTLSHGAALRQTAAVRLPSYRLFADTLLDPDQSTAAAVLAASADTNNYNSTLLLADYFSETAKASVLCSLLLKDIEQVRVKYNPLKAQINEYVSGIRSFKTIYRCLSGINSLNYSKVQLQELQKSSDNLLRRLESSRRKARSKLRIIKRLKIFLAVILSVIAVSASVVGVCIALHVFVAILVLPPWVAAARRSSARGISRTLAQIDAAAKGTYILNRDLDTIRGLVARLSDEVEHLRSLVRMFRDVRGGGGRRKVAEEVVRLVVRNDAGFTQLLDELEEHLYLCFMTINKARSQVLKEMIMVQHKAKVPSYVI